jgi:hypothetical protein
MVLSETDPILFMQAQIARLFRERHNMSIDDFNELDSKIHILRFIEIGYEYFTLTGEEGILDEVDEYCRIKSSKMTD